MSLKFVALVVALLSGVAPAAAAQAVPVANSLIAACQAAPGTKEYTMCDLYIDGFLRGAQTYQKTRWPSCGINTAYAALFRTKVEAALKSHPELFRDDFGIYFSSIFEAEYPCPK